MGSRREIPTFTHPLVETHCHLDYLKNENLDTIIEKSQAHNVEKIITIAVEPNNLDAVLEIAQKYPMVYATQGIHPHNSNTWDLKVREKILQNLRDSQKVVAIGEIGLDYYYDKHPRKIQMKAFEDQIQLAIENDFPIVIHTRDAEDDTMAILKAYSKELKKRAVIHSFTSKVELAELAVDLDLFIGFNGIITFKNADDVRESLKVVPMENILIETDAPFLTPVPYRGRENAPYYLPFVIEKIAEFKETPIEQALEKTKLNALELFSRLPR